MSLSAQPGGTTLHVAAGVVFNPERAFLLTTRPADKSWAGYWEFPGGKREAGESVLQALARELHEEIGITIDSQRARAWRHLRNASQPHIMLHFYLVGAWQGQLHMRETQNYAWCHSPPTQGPLLPSTTTVLQWLAQDAALIAAALD